MPIAIKKHLKQTLIVFTITRAQAEHLLKLLNGPSCTDPVAAQLYMELERQLKK